jgi:ribosome-binding factor A
MNSHNLFDGVMITVREVSVSPDLGLVRAYLSLFPVNDKEALLDRIRLQSRVIRHELAQRIRHQVRKIPAIEFFLDESIDYAQHMEEVFKRLREEEESNDAKGD